MNLNRPENRLHCSHQIYCSHQTPRFIPQTDHPATHSFPTGARMAIRHRSSQTQLCSLPRPAQFAFRCVAIVIAGLACTSTTRAQDLPSPRAVTEIWMSGDDLAVTKRILQGREAARQSYDEVARSMVSIAESRHLERDHQTADWLCRWARQLTNGRIGSKVRVLDGHSESGTLAASMSPPNPFQNQPVRATETDNQRGLAIEWPISAFTIEPPLTDERQVVDFTVAESQQNQPSDRLEVVLEQETNRQDSTTEIKAGHEAAPESLIGVGKVDTPTTAEPTPAVLPSPDFLVPPAQQPLGDMGRRVALLPATANDDSDDRLASQPPSEVADERTTLALRCFAAGVACCFVLHAFLLLTPIRLLDSRRRAPASQVPDDTSADTIRPTEPVAAVRREPLAHSSRLATRDLAKPDDGSSSMVEQFYNSNVELFERLAKAG